MDIPSGTYRIQFNKNFSFRHFEEIVEYLYHLGIDTVYASPILRAVPGSTHGYDGTDVNTINPELGTLDQLATLKDQLARFKIKWLQDIVPNHMAYHHKNGWLMDILEYGNVSSYSTYFDTAHHSPLFKNGKLMVPILGKDINEILQSNEITVTCENEQFYLVYFDHRLPINPTSYKGILGDLLSLAFPDFNAFIHRLYTIPGYSKSPEWRHTRQKIFTFINFKPYREKLNQRLAAINSSKEKVRDILSEQHYELCHWEETNRRINYRRFFTVNGLICLNVQDNHVFKDVHRFIEELLSRKIVDGFRIDHIDGLHSPAKYLRELRKLCGPDAYIVVEKILERGENLPGGWPIQGTTGYDFLALCNNVCTDSNSEKLLTHFYEKLSKNNISIKDQQIAKKNSILSNHMQGEIDNLCQLFLDLGLDNEGDQPDFKNLREAIKAFLVYFPVYRLYEEDFPFSMDGYTTVIAVFDTILREHAENPSVAQRLRFVIERAQNEPDPSYRKKAMVFFQRCMQFTGAVMAKGVEDTLMYTYNRFIGHNEVGDHPANFGISISAFHDAMRKRQTHWPSTLNATATHDTKRGEDVRSRLQVLTASPEAWIEQVEIWQEIVKEQYNGELPHPNDVYFIYQAMFGSYPMPNTLDNDFKDRFLNYLTKYLREGKERSDWAAPNTVYEQCVHHFVQFLLDKEGLFFPSFQVYLKRMADFGIINSLTQLVLKFTCPGAPDIYQGTELWDLSFVDPDNRREVDYAVRQRYLQEITEQNADTILASLWEERYNGKIKLWLIKILLALRKKCPSLSLDGEYISLEVKGKYHRHVLAYARRHQRDWLVIVVPLHLAAMENLRDNKVLSLDWEDTTVVLPNRQSVCWQHMLCPLAGEDTELRLSNVFKDIPLAVVRYSVPPNLRSAGVLMHITSLPSPFGIGDLGSGASDFVRFLQSSGQRWWQILPLGPTSHSQCYSPYSTRSTMAGNPLVISLKTLADEGLLTQKELEKAMVGVSTQIDFLQVESVKRTLLHLAFERADPADDSYFKTFCEEEAYWLDDYALFVALHDTYSDAPWYLWPEPFKSRDPKALAKFEAEQRSQLLEEKWIQYIFFRQWKKLKRYCHELGVYLIGDVPMYVGHDSADVWAHPHLFSLENDGSIRSIAGVPPDYFNADGQLWGMPVYNWEAHQKDHYRWWMARLGHNCKLFDKMRLDHFRAFEAYWEVSAKDQTARNGRWKSGPGKEFFTEVQCALGKLPFVVEDLGDIDDAVYELRNAFKLPGTKVLQFAFGDDMASSPHIPHNYNRNFFVYTGTHDNNTIMGWFNEELDDAAKERISMYTSVTADKTNISDLMIKMAYASVANTVIVPLQDLFSLPAWHRMNNPASMTGNWSWIAPHDAFNERVSEKLRLYTQLYGRA